MLRPPPGWTLIEIDWDAQEIGIVAGLSGDPGMIADYRSGDPHLRFGIRARLLPPDANKNNPEYGLIRNKTCKPVVHGSNYGMTPYGIAAKTGRSLEWARDIHHRHRIAYPIFHRWLGDTVAQAKFDGVISTPFGWPLAVITATRTRTLMNFPVQGGGADAMRIAAIAATEAGIRICAPVHDAFWLLTPDGEVERTATQMREIMTEAGAAVAGGLPITASVESERIVRSDANLGDRRRAAGKGQTMWNEAHDLIANGSLRQAKG